MKLKKIITLSIAFCSLMTIGKVSAHISESQLGFFIETGNFKTCVLEAYNEKYAGLDEVAASRGDIQERLAQITKLECERKDIMSVEGIQYLTGLTTLNLYYNNLREIDLSKNTALTNLYLSNNNLREIDLSKNTALTNLHLSNNNLSAINLNKNKVLKELVMSDNNLREINLSKNIDLTWLTLINNNLSEVDLSKNTALKNLYLSNNNLSEVDLSKNTALKNLYLSNNNLSEVDLSKNTALKNLYLSNNNLSEVDLSKNTALTNLYLSNNNLSEVDLSKNTALIVIDLGNNNFSTTTGTKYNLGKVIVGEKLGFKEYVKFSKKTKVSYISSNPEIATVDENGNISGEKEGTTTITLTSKDNQGNLIYEVNEVTVTKKVVSESTTEKTEVKNTEQNSVKNPETSDKGMIYGGGLTLTIGTIIAIRKKLKLLGI
jgi:Leucine-rich repeat (LRR) protein